MKRKKIKIALVQFSPSKSKEENLEIASKKIILAAKREAKIICLPELFNTPYFPQRMIKKYEHFSEKIPGPLSDELCTIAKKCKVVIVAPYFENAGKGKFYNSAIVIDADGRILGIYRKNHIPFDTCFYEKLFFDEGNCGYPVFKTKYADISVMICYDQWFPEAARVAVLDGAEIIFYPTAIGYVRGMNMPEGDWKEAWQTVQRAHAISNGVHIAAVNRTGTEGRIEFWGNSFVADSFGNIIAKAPANSEKILVAEIDLSKNKIVKEGWGFIKNRRPETYGRISKKRK